MLIISGREQALINVGGDKINPERVEAVLMAFPGVEQAAVIADGSELGIPRLTAGIVSANPIDPDALTAFCKSRLDAAFVPVKIVRVAQLPVNEMGKLERSRLSSML
jgi:acyl-CoA synthetase (AMP-forming)/AMP-acid ligase II